MCQISTAGFNGDRSAPQRARAFCAHDLSTALRDGRLVADVTADCVLVISELVTNAVNAKCTHLDVTLNLHRAQVRIEVRDDADGHPQSRTARPDDTEGRGLTIVEHLTQAWGVDPNPTGKTVWADIALPPGITPALECAG